jgi:hypothetical protein
VLLLVPLLLLVPALLLLLLLLLAVQALCGPATELLQRTELLPSVARECFPHMFPWVLVICN